MTRRTRATAKKNPVREWRHGPRGDWRGEGREKGTDEVPTWLVVPNIVDRLLRRSGRLHGSSEFLGCAIEVITSDDGAEVAVYFVDPNIIEPHADDLENEGAFAWTKTNATMIVRGEIHDNEASCIRHAAFPPDDACSPACEMASGMGWRGLLRSFITGDAPWKHMSPRVPVIVDGAEPEDLNVAILSKKEHKAFEEISRAALGWKKYEETNKDSISDVPEGAGPSHVAAVLMAQGYLQWDENGSFTQEMNPNSPFASEATKRWCALLDHVPAGATEQNIHDIHADLVEHLRYAIRSAEVWTRDEWVKAYDGPPFWAAGVGTFSKENAKALKILTYARCGQEEVQLPEGGAAVSLFLTEIERENVRIALDNVNVEWDPEESGVCQVEIDAWWVFTLDIDDLQNEYDEIVGNYVTQERD